jgi:hypothetical protein
MRRFRSVWKWLVPGWLQRGEGELIQYTLGLVHDAFAERCRQTAWLMLPSLAPDDALDMIGRDRGLKRGLFEPEANYRERLKQWRYPRGHRVRGSALALLDQVSVAIRGTEWSTIDARGTRYDAGESAATSKGGAWDWDGEYVFPNWGRYWVVVKSTGASWPSWDDGAWGDTWDADSSVSWAGDGVHPGEVAAVRELTRVGRLSWTPAGRRPVYLIIYFDGDPFPVPGGNWDSWENRDDAYAYEPLHDSEV